MIPVYKFEFTAKEAKYILDNAGFTDEEAEIFNLRRRGKSIVSIACYTHASTRTVDRRVASIIKKIKRIL